MADAEKNVLGLIWLIKNCEQSKDNCTQTDSKGFYNLKKNKI